MDKTNIFAIIFSNMSGKPLHISFQKGGFADKMLSDKSKEGYLTIHGDTLFNN